MKFKHRPNVVEAIQFSEDPLVIAAIKDLLGQALLTEASRQTGFYIRVFDGSIQTVRLGDWIVVGNNGQTVCHPHSDEVFQARYEPMSKRDPDKWPTW